MEITKDILEKANYWTSENFDRNTRDAVSDLLKNNPQEIIESFHKDLDFGTGGMRGIMSVGTNRVNEYTLGLATQGLSNYLKKQYPGVSELKVAIAHDSRNNSRKFSETVANVLSANGIHVYLFESLRPTPELSYAVRKLNCQSGIVLTASHNPKEYNGYKVYWNDGGQLVPPHDQGVIAEVRNADLSSVNFNGNPDLITLIGEEIDTQYIEDLKKLSLSNRGKEDLKIVFTSLHGTAITLLPAGLKAFGFTNFKDVAEQSEPNGNFPTVKSPNPEEAAALQMAVELAEKENADLVIGTDPDSDRVGIAVRSESGKMVLLNGNQTASLLIEYILRKNHENGLLQGNEFIAETVVTTDLLEKIADKFKVKTKKCLTGFKWIAEIIRELEGSERFLVGGEESYGYLIGDFVRDKDAIASALILAEIAAEAKSKNTTLLAELKRIHCTYGHFQEDLVSLTKKGIEGSKEIEDMMQGLRNNTPKVLANESVEWVFDYTTGVAKNLLTGESKKIELPKTNMVQVTTVSGTKFTARPSGTEPKIKFYISVSNACNESNYAESLDLLNQKIRTIKSEMKI